jgi:rfaE bifunctional protein nucleotidyltransferase chain/domain
MGAILDFQELEQYAAGWHDRNLQIVLTNGCFDLVHVGHLFTFREAKKWGDILVVGLNSDRSVKALKGDSRPIISEHDRSIFLSALEPIDFVTIFDDNTAAGLIEKVRPHFYVKGGDYSLDILPEKPVLERLNIPVKFTPLIPGISTTEIMRKIKSTPNLTAPTEVAPPPSQRFLLRGR